MMLRKLFNLSEPTFPSLKNRDSHKTTINKIQYVPNTQMFQLAIVDFYQEFIAKTNVLTFISKLLISATPLYRGRIRYMFEKIVLFFSHWAMRFRKSWATTQIKLISSCKLPQIQIHFCPIKDVILVIFMTYISKS